LYLARQDWQITVCSHECGWQFYCSPVNGEALTNHQIYPSSEAAIKAAKKFVDRAIVRLELGLWVDSLLESGQITPQKWEIVIEQLGYLMRD
jgi:hypothetical protein